jgi:short-subunit dehydrogenase
MKNKTALITGASSGIGKELAIIHAEKGGNLVLVARREEKLIELKKELENTYSVKVYLIIKDLSKLESVKEIYDEIKQQIFYC